MLAINTKEILERYKKAEQRKDLWRDIYQECYEYALPQRNLYGGEYESGSPAQRKMGRVFDSTAIHSTQRFANKIKAALFPSHREWIKLQSGSDIPPDRKTEVQLALDQVNQKMFNVINNSNFDMAIGEFLLDLCVGTGCMLVLAGDESEPIKYIAVPQYLICFDEGPFGKVENVYRKMRMKNSNILREFPDAEVPKELADKINDKPNDDTDLIEATIYDADNGVYNYCIIYKKGQEKIVERSFETNPWIISRYMKVAGEIYGRGPLVTALPDIKTLNKTVELLLKNASINIAGVYTAADDGVLNPQTVKIAPAAIIPVASNGGPRGPSLQPLARSGDIQLSQITLERLQNNIKKIMLDDSLPPDTMSARSATEIVERMKELSQNLGSAFGRMISEAVIPIVSRTLAVMNNAELIDLPLRVNGLEVKIQPTSPLALAQTNEEVQKTLQWIQMASQFGPAGQMAIKVDAAADYLADQLGIPPEVRTTMEEREQMAQQMTAMAQQQSAQQQAQAEAPQEADLPDQAR